MPTNTGALIYGPILVATLLSAESARQETYPKTVAAVLVALIAYWLTIAYSEYAGERLERGTPFSYSELAHEAVRELALLIGAAVPLVVLLVIWVAGASLGTAVSAAIWSAAVGIVTIEVVSGVRAGLRGGELARQSAVGALLGLAVIGMRLLLH